jgi:hypothetical protein
VPRVAGSPFPRRPGLVELCREIVKNPHSGNLEHSADRRASYGSLGWNVCPRTIRTTVAREQLNRRDINRYGSRSGFDRMKSASTNRSLPSPSRRMLTKSAKLNASLR